MRRRRWRRNFDFNVFDFGNPTEEWPFDVLPDNASFLALLFLNFLALLDKCLLRSKGFSVGGLHGDMSQAARMEALQNFKTGKTGLLVATDVAARGLDIPNVAAVINYTFPLTIEDYIHRIGRTGMSTRLTR